MKNLIEKLKESFPNHELRKIYRPKICPNGKPCMDLKTSYVYSVMLHKARFSSIRKLCKLCRMDYRTIKDSLDYLQQVNLVQKVRLDRWRICGIDRDTKRFTESFVKDVQAICFQMSTTQRDDGTTLSYMQYNYAAVPMPEGTKHILLDCLVRANDEQRRITNKGLLGRRRLGKLLCCHEGSLSKVLRRVRSNDHR